MITYIDGQVIEFDKSGVLILGVGPLGVEITTPALVNNELKEGYKLRMYTYLTITNERLFLYGFFSAFDRNLFKLLLTATQVGPRAALSILELGGGTVARAITSGDARTLTAASGIGTKKAERIVFELKDRIAQTAAFSVAETSQTTGSQGFDSRAKEAQDALITLGFSNLVAVRAVNAVLDNTDVEMDTVDLVKAALKTVKSL